MNYRLLIRPEAEADLDEARRWYGQRRVGLNDDFLLCVEDAIGRICRNPYHFGVVHQDIRRTLVRRFPYGIFYRAVEQQVIVLGVFHGSRDPKSWRSRV